MDSSAVSKGWSSCAPTHSDMTPEQAAASAAFETGLLSGVAAVGVPAVGVELSGTEPSQVTWYKSKDVSSVDDLDAPAGQAALAYALAGAHGAFGVKPTADSLLPSAVPVAVRAFPLVLAFAAWSAAGHTDIACAASCGAAPTTQLSRARLPVPLGVLIVVAALLAIVPLVLIERLGDTAIFYPQAILVRGLRAGSRLPRPDRRHARRRTSRSNGHAPGVARSRRSGSARRAVHRAREGARLARARTADDRLPRPVGRPLVAGRRPCSCSPPTP